MTTLEIKAMEHHQGQIVKQKWRPQDDDLQYFEGQRMN